MHALKTSANSVSVCPQDPQLRPSVAQLLQHEFLQGAEQQAPGARRTLASLARRRQALNLQMNVRPFPSMPLWAHWLDCQQNI